MTKQRSMRRLWGLIGGLATLAGCQTKVDLTYQAPSSAGNWIAADQQATAGFTYVELATAYIVVAPTAAAAPATGAAPGSGAGSGSKPAAGKDSSTAGKAKPKTAAATTSTADKAPTDSPAAAAPAAAPATLDPALATTLIDGKSWTAKVIPVPKDTYGFLVRGDTKSFWKTTDLTISRYANSDIASAVTVKAQNLVATRIGQFAGVAASLVSVAGTLGVAGVQQVPAKPLLPFALAVSPSNDSDSVNDGWTWSLTYDSGPPAGTVSFADFLHNVASKTVSYWPTPACRAATLAVYPPNSATAYDFRVMVSTPDYIRLEPLPVDGTFTPGAICSASVTGTTSVDPVATFADEVSALQQGIEKAKPAKPAGSSSKAADSKGDTAKPADSGQP
jgi:hypothetical protein